MESFTLGLMRGDGAPLYRQLYRHIVEEIASGGLAAGEKLPSKRRLAADLRVSVSTVETAYQMLVAEGYIAARAKSGFTVCRIEKLDAPVRPAPAAPPEPPAKRWAYDFGTGSVDTALFPFKTWARIQRETVTAHPELLNHGSRQGDASLRAAIAKYLHAYRGVVCAPEQIVVGAGIEYLVGLLASELLPRFPGARIIYDTRVYWNTRELIQAGGGVPVMGKTGHAFMKERMRAEDAVYGGEMSAHHYFRDFAYCDSGMLPWLLVIAAMQRHGKPLAELVRERMEAWPCSGEINRRVADAPALMRKIRDHYAPAATYEDAIDGVNLEFGDWRFNLRMSNTEPLLRLNVESRANRELLEAKTAELLALIDAGL